MLRVYDESQYQNRTRLKRLQILVLFGAGIVSGAWLTGNSGLLPEALAIGDRGLRAESAVRPVPASVLRSCFSDATTGLQIDCQLTLPVLPRADGV